MELGGAATVRAGHRGAVVSVFFCQVPLEGLSGDAVCDGADAELVVAEEVGVVRGGEVLRQFADLGVDGLADYLLQILDLS